MIMIMALDSIFPLRSRFHSRFQVRSDQQILNNLNCSFNIYNTTELIESFSFRESSGTPPESSGSPDFL